VKAKGSQVTDSQLSGVVTTDRGSKHVDECVPFVNPAQLQRSPSSIGSEQRSGGPEKEVGTTKPRTNSWNLTVDGWVANLATKNHRRTRHSTATIRGPWMDVSRVSLKAI
jgi:hypothetical protein